MDLYPAIDLLDGAAVRLTQGRYDAKTVYHEDPVEVAGEFAAAGARWLHLVDLDAARTGEASAANSAVLAAICRDAGLRVQCGGGIRDVERIGALLDLGVERVVLGTAAVERPQLLQEAAARWPGRVAAGLDHRAGEVRVRGWQEGSGRQLLDLVGELAARGAAALVVTDIGRDGMLAGPDLAGLADALAAAGDVRVIASGGVSGVADIDALGRLRSAGGAALAGVIVGKALYEGALTVPDALRACRAVRA